MTGLMTMACQKKYQNEKNSSYFWIISFDGIL
ncbi:hypothetical protein SAMN05660206_102489 [Sphingobacterium wenxiniae]|uniref:Uncharacterized protein n=1 Tax=Sphingobacterium wenxiniae TaxID=683125 RepID=A0A1I6QRE5_9SPHI|nr:hypothetical protein SAMN05660206_102489 [Sphingobacterium wenxiniae]